MIYNEELTKRVWYMYRRGEMSEYLRNKGPIDPDTHHKLYQWVCTSSYGVHDNPWGIWDAKNHRPCDFLEAMEIFYSRYK